MKIIPALILIFCLNTFNSFAQIESKMKLAYSYFEQGDFENSERMFDEIYKKYPNSMEALIGLFTSLDRQSKYTQIVKLLESSKIEHELIPITLAEMYWRTGMMSQAEDLWEKTINKYPKDISVYNKLYDSFIQLQLFDKAIASLKTGRKNLNDPRLFTDEIIKLLIAVGNYKDGIEEILNDLYLKRNLPNTQGRIYALITTKDGNKYIKQRLEQEADDKSDNILTQTVLGWYYRTVKNYKDAFKLFIRLDDLKGDKGRTIYNFAEESRKDFHSEIAKNAYELIIDTKKYHKYRNQSIYGYAKTLEQIMKSGDIINPEDVKKIIQRYEVIINTNTGPKAQADANYRISQLYKHYLNDNEKSKKHLLELVNKYMNYETGLKAALDLSMIYLFEDNLKKGIETLISMKQKAIKKFSDYKNKADFQLAKLYYYSGEIDSANALFIELSGKVKSSIGNDAIDYAFFLDNNKDFRDMIKAYAKAELYELKGDKKTAMEIYDELANKNKKNEISRKSQLNFCTYLYKTKDYDQVINRLELFIDDQFDFIELDEAIILLADSYYKKGEDKKAIETLTKILINNPNSIHIQKVRDKIRHFRGES